MEADAAHEEVGQREGGDEREDLDGVLEGERTEDEIGAVEIHEAEEEGVAGADGEEIGLGGAEGGERDVVAIEDDDGATGEKGGHGSGLFCVDADGEEAQPLSTTGGRARGPALKPGEGEVKRLDDGGGGDAGLRKGGRRGDDGDTGDCICRSAGRVEIKRQKLVDGELLGGEDAVQAFEGEGAAAVEEVRDMGLLEAGELGEAGAGEDAGLDAACEFLTEEFVEVCEVHRVSGWSDQMSLR